MHQSKETCIHTFYCDRCKEKIYEGDKQRYFPDRMNSWPVTFKNHLGHMQTFHVVIQTKEQNRSTNIENDSHYCLDCAKLILQTTIAMGEFTYDNEHA